VRLRYTHVFFHLAFGIYPDSDVSAESVRLTVTERVFGYASIATSMSQNKIIIPVLVLPVMLSCLLVHS
jgi:hypothetical protein